MGILAMTRILPNIKDKLGEHPEVPPWLVLGWISEESGGNVTNYPKNSDGTPKLLSGRDAPEYGLFQLDPQETASLGYDHERIHTDIDYSLDAGFALIDKYAHAVESAGVPRSAEDGFWWLVKFAHTVGSGSMRSLVTDYKATHGGDVPRSIDDARAFYLSRGPFYQGHEVLKWAPFMDRVVSQGKTLAMTFQFANPQMAIGVSVVGLSAALIALFFALRAKRKRKANAAV